MSDRRAWAITTGDVPGHFIGVLRFSLAALPPWHNGFRVALFDTRKKARDHLAKVKGPKERGLYPHAHVVPVVVSLKVAA